MRLRKFLLCCSSGGLGPETGKRGEGEAKGAGDGSVADKMSTTEFKRLVENDFRYS